MVQFLAKEYSIGISWIPREANIIADKICKLEPTLKEKEWNLLKLFVALVKKQCHNIKDIQANENKKISELNEKIRKQQSTIELRDIKISNQAKQINSLRDKKVKN